MASALAVNDSLSNLPETIEHHVDVLRGSANRQAVFRAIYSGRKDPKSVSEIMQATGLGQQTVLKTGLALARSQMVNLEKTKNKDGTRTETAYRKDALCVRHRDKIMRLVANPERAKTIATKRRPAGGRAVETIVISKKAFNAVYVAVDDIESFQRVRGIESQAAALEGMSENDFKNGVKAILGETAPFKDWGGEKSDLMTTRLRVAGKRRPAAFAFKGPGQSGKLTIAKMGKNGDQCQRLFQEPAEVFVIQHWRAIDSAVLELMSKDAKLKSYFDGRTVYYCLMDGNDSDRLVRAYPEHFSRAKRA